MRLLLRNRCIIKHIIVYVSLILSPLCLLTPHACPADAASHEPDAAGSSGSENQGNGIFTFNGLPAEEQQAGQPARALVMEGYGKLPLSFIRNDGQIDERVRYYERGSGHSIFFTKEGIYLSLQQTTGTEVKKGETATPADSRLESIRLFPMGGSKAPEIAAEDQQKGVVNYFVGSPEKWRSNIPAYSAVAYKGIYRGVDMRFYGNNRQLEYDVIVQPGASLSRVQLCYEGIDDLRIREDGDLEIALTGGNVVQKKPYMYQMIKGKKVEVQGEFRILKAGGKRQKPAGQNVRNASRSRQFIYGFKVASYDKRQPLVIDPTLTLEYSTYLGGSYNEEGKGIAVDGSGNAYITGTTWSSDFPIKSAYQLTNSGSTLDVFVTKINTLGSGTSSLVYSTYLGGTDYDFSSGIAVDGSGNAYITGYTSSSDFPTTPSAYQGNKIGFDVAFVTKLSPSGNSLVYSTYLGGSDGELGSGIAVDGSGNAYVTGATWSSNFPTTPSAYQGNLIGYDDVFVAKIDTLGSGTSSLVYSTYLGGYYYNIGSGIAVDGSGNAYVTGATWSDDFPTTPSAYQGTITAGAKDGNVFVTKINTLGSGTSSLVYSTYLGGSGSEEGKGIAVDGSGNAYITGNTSSSDFPTTPSAYKGTTDDVFVAKIDTLGSGASSLVYSTYLGGSDGELGSGIAVDGSGNAYITGLTDSTNFPTTPSAYQGNLIGYADVFVTKIDTLGSGTSSLVYSTYLGGTFMDYGQGIAVDGSGNAYITGLTDSTNFPTTPSAYQGTLQGTYYGDRDAFVSKLSLPPELPNAITLVYFHASAGKDGSVTLTWETATEVDNAGFNLYRSRKKDGDYKKINDTLIPAMGNATTGAKYSYTDTPPAKGTYYYKLEDVDYNGISTMHGQEKVKVKIMSGDAGTKKSKRKKGR